MSDTKRSFPARLLRGLGRFLNGIRIVVLNLVFFFILFLVLGTILSEQHITVDDGIALVIDPEGQIVEQYTGEPAERAIQRAMGNEEPQARMRDLLLAIDSAATDDRIKALVIDTDRMQGAGLSQLQELSDAIVRFKKSGKPVYAYGDYFEQGQYYLAAQADNVEMHPEGLLLLEGLSRYRTYMKDGLDKLAVDVHLFRVGKYKSAAEPYIRNDMSEEAKQANLAWLGDLWDSYVQGVADARKMEPVLVRDYIDRYGERLASADDDSGRAAVEAGLVDKLANRDEFRKELIDVVGEDEDSHSFRQIDFKDYASAVRSSRLGAASDKVAVVVAEGPIVGGDQPPGTIGAESTAKLIRDARFDKNVKAVVFRVDSGGGSAFASEVIRRELELTRAAGKPVVVSMSSVAASGGYWISMTSDRIYAEPTTITGSIGVFGMFLNFPRTLDKIGVHVDGVGTTDLAGAFNPGRPLDPKVGDIVQRLVEKTYDDFVHRVADNRGLEPERVKEIAQGRVWSGKAAHDLGLVDQFGGLHEAIAGAAELAGVKSYSVDYVERKLSPFERWLVESTTGVVAWAGLDLGTGVHGWNWLTRMAATLSLFTGPDSDPHGLYSYCFCRAPTN